MGYDSGSNYTMDDLVHICNENAKKRANGESPSNGQDNTPSKAPHKYEDFFARSRSRGPMHDLD